MSRQLRVTFVWRVTTVLAIVSRGMMKTSVLGETYIARGAWSASPAILGLRLMAGRCVMIWSGSHELCALLDATLKYSRGL